MIKRIASASVVLALLAGPALAQTPSTKDAFIAVRPMIADMQRIVTPRGVQSTETDRLGGMDQ